jgi:hypothetical protein
MMSIGCGRRPGGRDGAGLDHLGAALAEAGPDLEPATQRSFDRLFGC